MRKVSVLLVVFVSLACLVYAEGIVVQDNRAVSVWSNQTNTGVANNATHFIPMMGVQVSTASENIASLQIPVAGQFCKMMCKPTIAQTADGTYTITLRKNGLSTDMSCSLPAASPALTACEDAEDDCVTVERGDTVAWMSTVTDTPVATHIGCTVSFEAFP